MRPESIQGPHVVLQGHAEMWAAMRERDAIYADAQAGEEAFLRAALAAA